MSAFIGIYVWRDNKLRVYVDSTLRYKSRRAGCTHCSPPMVDAVAATMLLMRRGDASRVGGTGRPAEDGYARPGGPPTDTPTVDAGTAAPVPSDSDADSGDDVLVPPPDDESTLSTLPAASQLHRLFQTYSPSFTLEKIRFDRLNVEDVATSLSAKPREVPVPGKSSDVVSVVEGLNACLVSLIRELFKDAAISEEMKLALLHIVEPRARGVSMKALGTRTKHSLGVFYERLLSAITALQIACDKEDREATRDTTSTRRPNLQLWESVTADLTSLQCVFKKGARMGYLELGPNAIEPTSAIGLRNKQMAKTLKNIRTQERELIKLHERQADHDEQLQRLERHYVDVNPQIQRANANIGFLHSKLQSFTDIPLIVAETIAGMQAPLSHGGSKLNT